MNTRRLNFQNRNRNKYDNRRWNKYKMPKISFKIPTGWCKFSGVYPPSCLRCDVKLNVKWQFGHLFKVKRVLGRRLSSGLPNNTTKYFWISFEHICESRLHIFLNLVCTYFWISFAHISESRLHIFLYLGCTCQVGTLVDLSEGVGLLEAQLLVKVVSSPLLPRRRKNIKHFSQGNKMMCSPEWIVWF